MEISERVKALVNYVAVERSHHGCKLMPDATEHVLDELMGIHTSIAILESSPGVNKKLLGHAMKIYPAPLDPVMLAQGGTITTYRRKSVLTPILNLIKKVKK